MTFLTVSLKTSQFLTNLISSENSRISNTSVKQWQVPIKPNQQPQPQNAQNQPPALLATGLGHLEAHQLLENSIDLKQLRILKILNGSKIFSKIYRE